MNTITTLINVCILLKETEIQVSLFEEIRYGWMHLFEQGEQFFPHAAKSFFRGSIFMH